MGDRDDLTYVAPVLPLESDPEGEVYWPCPHCLPWHLEVVTDP